MRNQIVRQPIARTDLADILAVLNPLCWPGLLQGPDWYAELPDDGTIWVPEAEVDKVKMEILVGKR